MGEKVHNRVGSAVYLGEVIGISGNTFTSRDGNWVKIYDKTGKKINTRST